MWIFPCLNKQIEVVYPSFIVSLINILETTKTFLMPMRYTSFIASKELY